MSRLISGLAGCLLAAAMLSGCTDSSNGRPQTVEATATITYNGSPVGGATVTFSPAGESGNAAYGKTDATGKVALSTFGGEDGAVPGSYKVMVTKTEVEGAAAGAGDDESSEEEEEEATVTHKQLLPEKYARVDTTDLEATVSEGGDNNFTFDLKD